MKKIIMHWTAGAHVPSFFDKNFYHFLVDSEGGIHKGIYPPEANHDVSDGKYAAHCAGGNTNALGVALCAMANFKNRQEVGDFPIKSKQLEAFFELCAVLCIKYNIPVTTKTVLTHMEFGEAYPSSGSAGKIDICYLPPYPQVAQANVGAFMRQKIRWYIAKLQKQKRSKNEQIQ